MLGHLDKNEQVKPVSLNKRVKIFYGCGRKEHVWASSLEQNEDWKKKASNIEHWFVWDEIYLPISGSGGLVCFICNCGEYRVNQYPTNQG